MLTPTTEQQEVNRYPLIAMGIGFLFKRLYRKKGVDTNQNPCQLGGE